MSEAITQKEEEFIKSLNQEQLKILLSLILDIRDWSFNKVLIYPEEVCEFIREEIKEKKK